MNQRQIHTAFALCIFVASGCTSNLEYDTHADDEQLRALKDRPVLILQFDYKDDVLLDLEPLGASLGNRIAEQQKASLITRFESSLALKDVSKDVAARYGNGAAFDDTAFVRRVLEEGGGDGGLVITVAYAYKMATGSLKDELVAQSLKKVLPKDAVGVITGPSQVASYAFASKAILLNKAGRVVWSFYGKAFAMPTFSTMFRPTEFARSVAGLDPSEQNLALMLNQMSDGYDEFLAWMMQQDMNSVRQKNYFRDYPDERRNKYLSIFPAETKAYGPFVKGYGQLDK